MYPSEFRCVPDIREMEFSVLFVGMQDFIDRNEVDQYLVSDSR